MGDEEGEIEGVGVGLGEWGDRTYIRCDRTECSFMCLFLKLHSLRNSHVTLYSESYYYFPSAFFFSPLSLLFMK